MIDIAPYYQKEIHSEEQRKAIALARAAYTEYNPFAYQKKNGPAPEIKNYIEEQTDGLRYMLYPGNIESLVSKTNTPESIMQSAINFSAQYSKKPLTFIPQRVEDTLLRFEDFRNGIGDMITAAWDTETLELTDQKTGKLHSMVMEFGFVYQSVGNKQFTKYGLLNPNATNNALISSGLIGVTDQEMIDLLDEIATRVDAKQELSKEQKLVFDFLSRIGDSGTVIDESGLSEGWANIVSLTNKEHGEYATGENYRKALDFFKLLGKKQKRTENGREYNIAQMRMAENMAYLGSDDVDLVIGKNALTFDVPRAQRDVLGIGTPYAERYAALRGAGATFAKDVSGKTADLDQWIRMASANTVNKFNKIIYSGDTARFLETTGFAKQENILRALGMEESTSHAAFADAQQLLRMMTEKDSRSWGAMTVLIEDLLENKQAQDNRLASSLGQVADYQIEGSLFQARTQGSMRNISKYQNYIAGAVSSSNGNIYYTNGVTWNAANQQYIKSNQYAPGLWNQDFTYEFTEASFLKTDEIKDPLIRNNPRFSGERILHLKMHGYGGEGSGMTDIGNMEKFQQQIDIFIPESMSEQFLADNFGAVRMKKRSGGSEVTPYGRKQIKNYIESWSDKEVSAGVAHLERPKGVNKLEPFAKLNQRRVIDNAERSLNKYSQNTVKNAIGYKELVEELRAAKIQQPEVTLYNTIYKDLNAVAGNQEFTGIKALFGTKDAQQRAIEIAQGFKFNEEFNPNYLENIDIIARHLQNGSVLSTLDTMITDAAKKYGLEKDSYTFQNAYTATMKSAISFLRSNPLLSQDSKGYKVRAENQEGIFYIPLEKLATQRRIGKVAGTSNIPTLAVHFDNVSKTMGSMIALQQLPNHLKNDPAYTRDAVLKAVNMVADSEIGDLKIHGKGGRKTIRAFIEDMIGSTKNPINQRNAADIANELTSLLKRARNEHEDVGYKTTDFYEDISSFILKTDNLADTERTAVADVIDASISAIKNRGNSFADKKTTVQRVYEALTKEASIDKFATTDASDYSKLLVKANVENWLHDMTNYSEFLVTNIEKCGGRVRVSPGGQIEVLWGNGDWENIMDRVVQYKTNSVGFGYTQFGKTATRHSARPELHWAAKGDPYTVKTGTSLGRAINMMSGRNKERMEQQIAMGYNSKEVFSKFLGRFNEIVGRDPLAGTSLTEDFQHEFTLRLDSLLYHGHLEKYIPQWQKDYKDNPEMLKAIGQLEQYVQNVRDKGMRPEDAWQFLDDVSAMKLFAGNDAIIHFTDDLHFMKLTTDFKKSSSGLDAGINSFAYPFRSLLDQGKLTVSYANQSAYFVENPNAALALQTSMDKESIRTLEDLNIGFGSRFTTAEQNAIARFEDKSGARLTNALQVPIVETNVKVKEEILRQINNLGQNTATNQSMFAKAGLQRSNEAYYRRASNVISSRLNVTEGGGLYNGYLTDILDTSWGTQVIRLNDRDFVNSPRFDEAFRNATAYQFENGKFRYGTGKYNRFNEVIAEFQNRYGTSEEAKEFAKTPSIARIEFMTKDGRALLGEEDVLNLVQKTANKNIEEISADEFEKITGQLFDRVLVNRSIYETDFRKLLFDEEKHISASSTAFLGNMFNDEEILTEAAENLAQGVYTLEDFNADHIARETLLYKMLHTDAFNDIEKRSGTKWRGNVALRKDVYDAIANLDFNHAIFQGIDDNGRHEVRKSILELYQHYTGDTQGDPLAWFKKAMAMYRNSVNEPLWEATGHGLAFGASVKARAKHHDVSMLVESTVDFIQKELFARAGQERKASVKNLKDAVAIFDQFNVLTHEDGTSILLAKDMAANAENIFVPENVNELSLDAIRQGIVQFANGDQAVIERWEQSLTELKNLVDGKIVPSIGTLRNVIDATATVKTLNITDREMSRFSARVWNDEIKEAIEKHVQKNWADKKFSSRYLAGADFAQRAQSGTVLGKELIDYLFAENAFAGFKDNDYGTSGSFEKGTGIQASAKFDPKKYIKSDTYRARKTEALVKQALQEAGVSEETYVSQEFADKLYATASVQAAAKFNKAEHRENLLGAMQSDWGHNVIDSPYFQYKNLKDDFTLFTQEGLQSMASDPNSILQKNTVWNMTDASIGLTEKRLGQHANVAVAGTIVNEFENANDLKSRSKDAPQAALERVYRARDIVAKAYNENPFSDTYEQSVADYIASIKDLERTVSYTASGKRKTSIANQVAEFRAAGSLGGKVNVTDTVESVMLPDSIDFENVIGEKTYQGKRLQDLIRGGTNVNYMIIGTADLEKMGFDDKYFNKIGIAREEWLQKARTEGIAGVGHRWPSIYWGSNMAVQVYVDDAASKGIMRMDEITAAFMKADADGDWAQLFMLGATQKNGQWIDEMSLREMESLSDKDRTKVAKRMGGAIRNAEQYVTGHTDMMLSQQAYFNKMIKDHVDTEKSVQEMYQDVVEKLRDNSHLDLSGTKIMPFTNYSLSEEERKQVSDAFLGVRDHLAEALERSDVAKQGDAFEEHIKLLREASSGEEAYQSFLSIFNDANDAIGLRKEMWNNLGSAQEVAQKAYMDANALFDADAVFLQRIIRGGAGVIDNPFTAADLLRREGLANHVITAEQSFAMDMIREHVQEDFLTPKQGTYDQKVIEDLGRVSDLYGKIFSGKSTQEERSDLVELIMERRRPTSKRYDQSGKGLLKAFTRTDGTVDDRKIAEAAVEGINQVSIFMNENATRESKGNWKQLLSTTQNMVRLNKMHTSGILWNQRTFGAVTQNAINTYDGGGIRISKLVAEQATKEGQDAIDALRGNAGFVEKVVKNIGKGGWSKNALALAGAVMLTGFVGGNPATPAQHQAQEQYNEQNPPPSNINLADPSLTVSGRKQPGYVININAQTQKDKDYASRVIAQAVTRNYQNTNVNVSMNVNQQPGNISGKEIADYLRQAF